MKTLLYYLIYILIGVLPTHLSAQTPLDIYHQEAGNFALIYSGKLEDGYNYGYSNTPYYPPNYTEGNLHFKGIEYRNIPLRIDYYTSRLIVQSPDGKYNIPVHPQEVDKVCIGKCDYIYLSKEANAPSNAYYAVLFQNKKWKLYKLRYISNINREYVGNRVLQNFSLKERIYLVRNGKWHEITGRNSFISHFKQYKHELQHYCKQHNLHLSKEDEEGWIRLALYCETLIK